MCQVGTRTAQTREGRINSQQSCDAILELLLALLLGRIRDLVGLKAQMADEAWSDCELEEQDFNFDRDYEADCGGKLSRDRRDLDTFRSELLTEVCRAQTVRTEALLHDVAALARAHANGEVKDGDGMVVTRLSPRMFMLSANRNMCYVDLHALGRASPDANWVQVGCTEIALCRGVLTHLAL